MDCKISLISIIGMVEADVRYHRFYDRETHGQGYWAFQVIKMQRPGMEKGGRLGYDCGNNSN